MGEFGCSQRDHSKSKDWKNYLYYLEYFVKCSKSYGIPCFLWDNGNPGAGAEHHAYIDHGTGKYVGNSEEAVKVMASLLLVIAGCGADIPSVEDTLRQAAESGTPLFGHQDDLMFRMVNEKKLEGMLWAISPNSLSDNFEIWESRYPGDEYVDIVGLDCHCSTYVLQETALPMFAQNIKRCLRSLKVCELTFNPDGTIETIERFDD